MESTKILYVEDDETLGFLTRESLSEAGYEVFHCVDGMEALRAFKKNQFDLCVFDVMLPKKDGFTLAKDIRALNSQIPIIFLTAKSLLEDKILGLTIGGDDYITKPYSTEELLLKVSIFLKRKLIPQEKSQVFKLGLYDFDYKNLTLKIDEQTNVLTQREADLLKLLVSNKANVLKREYILENIWGKNDFFLGRSMDVFISRLRKHLKKDAGVNIENVHGVGFRITF